MKHNFKKLASWLLSLAMIVTLLPATALAEDAVTEYDLWIGGVQVTSENRDNITAAINTVSSGAASGSAKYAPDTGTLTLDKFSLSGAGYGWTDSNSKTHNAAIYYSGTGTLNLVLSGVSGVSKVTAPSIDGMQNSYGIYSGSGLAVSGDGTLNATAGTAAESTGVYASGNITVSGGRLLGYGGTAAESNGVYASGSISISGGEMVAQGNTGAFNKAPTFNDFTPKVYCGESEANATVKTDPVDTDYTSSKYVRIAPPPEVYGLWIGGVQVTSENPMIDSNDTNAVTQGYATYEPGTNTLTLYGLILSGAGDKNAAIYYEGSADLTLVLVGVSTITAPDATSYGIYLNHSGSNKLTISGDAAGKLNVTAPTAALWSQGIDVVITGGTVTLGDAAAPGDYGAWLDSADLTVQNGATLTAEGKTMAILCDAGSDLQGIIVGDSQYIYAPVGGAVGDVPGEDTQVTILDGNGAAAKSVTILPQCSHEATSGYDKNETHHWIPCDDGTCYTKASGDIHVAGLPSYEPHQNTNNGYCFCGKDLSNVPAVYVGGVWLTEGDYLPNNSTEITDTAPASGGYAYYSGGTLTLNNFTLIGAGYVWGTGTVSTAAIYYGRSDTLKLKLVGDSAVTASDVPGQGNSFGIYSGGDLTVESEGGGALTATGGKVAGDTGCSYGAFAVNNITVSSGSLTGKSGTATNSTGVYADGNITISGGEVVAQGDSRAFGKTPTIASTFIDAKVWYGDDEATAKITGEGTAPGNAAENYHYNKYVRIAAEPAPIITYGLHIGNVEVTSENLTIDSADIDGVEGTATYAPDTGTLTLDNFTLSGAGYEWGGLIAAIRYDYDDSKEAVPLTLDLSGINTITAPDATSISYGIYCLDDLSFTSSDGTGTLTVTGGAAGSTSHGVYAVGDSVTISSGSVTAIGGTASAHNSYGLYAASLTVSGGTLTGEGGTVAGEYGSYGVYADAISVEGGKLIGKGGTATDGDSYGVDASYGEGVTISGGEVVAQGDSRAFAKNPTVTLDNAEIKCGTSADTAEVAENPDYTNSKYVHIAELLLSAPTVEDTGSGSGGNEDYWRIFANGTALILTAGTGGTTETPYTVIYIDEDRDGEVDENTDTIWAPNNGDTTAAGNDLSHFEIYGGSNTGAVSSTKITMLGGFVGRSIYGGGTTNPLSPDIVGTVTGDTCVTVSGGTVGSRVNGGGNGSRATVGGSTYVTISGDASVGGIRGGNAWNGTVEGDTYVTISDNASVGGIVYGGGEKGTVGGNTNINITGGTLTYPVDGGDARTGTVTGKANITISDNASVNQSVSVPNGGSITARGTTYTATDGKVTLFVSNDTVSLESGSVSVPAGGSITAEGTSYTANEGGATISVSDDTVSLTGGSVTMGSGETITVNGVEVIGPATVASDGTVTIGAGSSVQVGNITYQTDANTTATVTIAEDGSSELSGIAATDSSVDASVTVTSSAADSSLSLGFDAKSGNADVTTGKSITLGSDTGIKVTVPAGEGSSATITGVNSNVSVGADGNLTVTKVVPSNVVPAYRITAEDAENGEIKLNRSYAIYGTTVTITITPDTGYTLDTLSVTTSRGREVEWTDKGDGTYTFKMPGSSVTVTAVFKPEHKDCDGSEGCPSLAYSDLNVAEWYHQATDYVITNGLMNGVGNGKFDPDGTTSRAMIVTILWRLEGEPVVNYLMQFEDVPADTWYTEAVRWAASEKIVEGYSDTAFGPADPITREQFAAILWRYAQYKGYDVSVGEDTNILSYEDAFDISEWAIPAMQWACGAGLMEGDGVNLTPKADATRTQAAALFQRFCELEK